MLYATDSKGNRMGFSPVGWIVFLGLGFVLYKVIRRIV